MGTCRLAGSPIVSAGETVVAHARNTHRFSNIDKETSRMLVLITP
jgi:quercetin dioxygenase-like cupin family protein